MKNKYIYLNALVTIPSESGEEKIEKANSNKTVKDNITPYRNWFLEQNLIPPDDAEDIDEEGRVVLGDEDLEDVTVPLTIPIKNLDSWVASLDGGTVIYTKSNIQYTVIEEIWEVDAYLEVINMNWFERNWLLFLSFFRRKQNKTEDFE